MCCRRLASASRSRRSGEVASVGRGRRPARHSHCRPGCRQRTHFPRAQVRQHRGAFVQRCPRRAHIVHQHDNGSSDTCRVSAAPWPPGPAHGKGPAQVCPPCRCRQIHLRGGVAPAPKGAAHWEVELAGQQHRLVEASRLVPPPVERYRHDEVGSVQHLHSSLPHQLPERPGQSHPAFVLQPVDGVAQGSVIRTGRPSQLDGGGTPLTGETHRQCVGAKPPCWQGIAAADTEGRGPRGDRVPAPGTDRPGTRGLEWTLAGEAPGSQQHRQQRVEGTGEEHVCAPGSRGPGGRGSYEVFLRARVAAFGLADGRGFGAAFGRASLRGFGAVFLTAGAGVGSSSPGRVTCSALPHNRSRA